MPTLGLRALKRFLRSPATIVGELMGIAALGTLGAALPQVGVAPATEVARLRAHGAFVKALVEGLSLDHIFTSPAFLLALGLATGSLAIVVAEQLRRLRGQWGQIPTEAQFRNAPYRAEFTRPALGREGVTTRIRTRGRWALAGSPLFHTGLLCVILAGILRALFGVGAVVDVYEGETLPATVEAWGAQWPGPLGEPFRLDEPLVLRSVDLTQYGSGELLNLRLKLAQALPGGGRIQEMGINEELQVSRGRLFLGAEHGPTALVEWVFPASSPLRSALLLEKKETKAFGGYSEGPQGLLARIRVPVPSGVPHAGHAEVRILRGASVLAEGPLKPGEALSLPGGAQLRLQGLPTWVRLHGAHDPALGLAYLGFALALLGAALIMGVLRVDELVAIAPEGETQRVLVALRPHRYAPLFKDRFDRLVDEEGGPP